jgi:diacylglycerol kinase (ATP)
MSDNHDPTQGVLVRRTGLSRLLFTVVNSARGLRFLIKYEEAFQLEFALACVMIPLALCLSTSPVECLFLVGSVVIVLIVETLNTSIEVLTDRVGEEYNELAGLAKDLGSLAVTLSLVLCAVVWVTIVLTYSAE